MNAAPATAPGHSSSESRSTSSGLRRTKRVKIDTACDSCRARKVKCDGVRPACGPCSRKLHLRPLCHYAIESRGVTGLPRSTTKSDEGLRPPGPRGSRGSRGSRATNLLAQSAPPPLDALQNVYQSQAQPQGLSGSADACSVGSPFPSAAATSRASHVGPGGVAPSGYDHGYRAPPTIDSMTTMVDDAASTGEHFGSSSTGSFTAQIKAAIECRLGNPESGNANTGNPELLRPSLAACSRMTSPTPNEMDNTLEDLSTHFIPQRRQADRLLEVYWLYIDPLYPFLYRKQWDIRYDCLFTGAEMPPGTNEKVFLATLNVVFALATQMMESLVPADRDEASSAHAKRAQSLLPINSWGPASLELVQYLLLTSQYLQSTSRPHQTWMVVSSAIRISQSLGLHLPMQPDVNASNIDLRELPRRIWHGCVLMDRMVSLTHGRPTMVSQRVALAVPFPITGSSTGSQLTLTDAAFFVKSVQLYGIIHNTLTDLYSLSSLDLKHAVNKSDMLVKVLQLDDSLIEWQDSLPENLRPFSQKATTSLFTHRLAIILRLRYLHARVLLLRPVLACLCLTTAPVDSLGKTNDDLRIRMIKECARCCVDAAKETIDLHLQHQSSDGSVGLLPAWWYRVFFVFSAAAVLIAARLRADVFDPTGLSEAWGKAMQVFRAQELSGPSAKRCMTALQMLSSAVLQSGSSAKPTVTEQRALQQDGDTVPLESDVSAERGFLEDQLMMPFPDLDLAGITSDLDDFSWLDATTWSFLHLRE